MGACALARRAGLDVAARVLALRTASCLMGVDGVRPDTRGAAGGPVAAARHVGPAKTAALRARPRGAVGSLTSLPRASCAEKLVNVETEERPTTQG